MKDLLLAKIDNYIATAISIQNVADEIQLIRGELNTLLSDEENMVLTGKLKDKVQAEANIAIHDNDRSMIIGATGVGKTKIGIDRIDRELFRCWKTDSQIKSVNILLVVPTEKLRDIGWKEEFEKWHMINAWQFITPICYASLSSMINGNWDLVILDEVHNITPNNSIFFAPENNNIIKKVVALTATEPRDREKQQILKSIGLEVVYKIEMDIAVKLGLVSPYDIVAIGLDIDDTDKYVVGGTKEKRFYTTEKRAYIYRQRQYLAAPTQRNILARMRVIYDSKFKTEALKNILLHLVPEEERTLIFCATQAQANEVCPFRYYSKPTKPKKLRGTVTTEQLEKGIDDLLAYDKKLQEYQGDISLNAFINGAINRLASCNALNEGQNLPAVDLGLIGQMYGSDLRLIQRIGRHIRYRPGHRGKIVVLYIKDTVDEELTRSVLRKIDQNNITWIEYNKLRRGEQTINF